MIPNTTPVPNFIFDKLKNMSASELKIVLLVARANFGWIPNEDGFSRSERDWITKKELVGKIGNRNTATAMNIRSCLDNGWIEARLPNGKLLKTAEDRTRVGRGVKMQLRIGDGKKREEKEQQHQDTTQTPPPPDPGTKRKDYTIPSEVYKEIIDKYQLYKGVTLAGAEFGEVKRAIKTMIYSGRTKENIIDFMKFCWKVEKEINDGNNEVERDYGWLQNWTILTIKRKMPEFLSGKYQIKEKEVPDYYKSWVPPSN